MERYCTELFETLGVTQQSLTGRLRPEVRPLILLYAIFDRKGTLVIDLLLTNCIQFHDLLKKFAFSFNFFKCTVFKI